MKTLVTLFAVGYATFVCSQNIAINGNGAQPHPQAILHLDVSAYTSNNKKGFLAPKMTTAERNASFPFAVEGLWIYNTDIHCFQYYDGTLWVDDCGTSYPCPNGFVSVNEEYCIEIGQRQSLQIFVANDSCGSKNAHLCSWAEWHYACIRAVSLGLLNMTDDWEWVDNIATQTTFFLVGDNGNCESVWSHGSEDTHSSRCCYRKR